MLNEFHLQNIDMQRDSNIKSKDVNSAVRVEQMVMPQISIYT